MSDKKEDKNQRAKPTEMNVGFWIGRSDRYKQALKNIRDFTDDVKIIKYIDDALLED